MNSQPFLSLYSVNFFARFSYALARNPVLPLFALSFGAQPENIGLAVGISTVTGIFFKLPAGALSDIIGRKKTMLVGLLFFAFIPFLYFFIQEYTQLVIVRFFHGFATAIYGPVAMAVVADMSGNRKGEILSWFSSIAILGTLAGAPVGGFLLTYFAKNAEATSAFNVIYGIVAFTGIIAFLLGIRILKTNEEPIVPQSFKSRLHAFKSGIKEIVKDKRILATSSMEGVQNMSMGALEAFLPVYATLVAGLSAFEAGLLWGCQVATTMLTKPILGRFSDQFGRKFFIVAGMVCCAVPLLFIPQLTDFWKLLCACLIFGLGEALVTSSTTALVAELCRAQQYGTAMGVFGTIFDIGHASGPIIGGVLIATFGYQASFSAISAVLLLTIPIFWYTMSKGSNLTN